MTLKINLGQTDLKQRFVFKKQCQNSISEKLVWESSALDEMNIYRKVRFNQIEQNQGNIYSGNFYLGWD